MNTHFFNLVSFIQYECFVPTDPDFPNCAEKVEVISLLCARTVWLLLMQFLRNFRMLQCL